MGRIIIPRIVVRHLLPSGPEFAVRLRPQYLHWQVGRYKEHLVFGPGGLGKKRVWVPEKEGEQHNLILTQTYDWLIPVYGFTSLAEFAAVGTGTTPPNASQTGLVNEVARTMNDANPPLSDSREVTNGQFLITQVREFSESQVGGRSLTEWGFAPSTITESLMCRELFRDGSGNPITLNIATDQRLRLIYRYSFTYTPALGSSQSVSVNIANLGTRTAKLFLSRAASWPEYSPNPHIAVLDNWAANRMNRISYGVLGQARTPDPNATPNFVSGTEVLLTGVGTTAITRGRRINSRTFDAADANATWYGLLLVGKTVGYSGVIFLAFDPGQQFTKDNLHRVTVNEWTLTWGP
jgi:hypothetical protein